MARVCPGGRKPRRLIHYTDVKFEGQPDEIWKDDREAIDFSRLKCEISELHSAANVSSSEEKAATIQLHT